MGCGQKSFKLVWGFHQLSGFLSQGQLPRVSRQSRPSLMIRVTMKWSRGLYSLSDLLAFALQLRKTSARSLMKGLCEQSCLQWGAFPPNEVGRITQHVRKGEGRKEGKNLQWHNKESNLLSEYDQSTCRKKRRENLTCYYKWFAIHGSISEMAALMVQQLTLLQFGMVLATCGSCYVTCQVLISRLSLPDRELCECQESLKPRNV